MPEIKDDLTTEEVIVGLAHEFTLLSLSRRGLVPKRSDNTNHQKAAQACMDSFFNGIAVAMGIAKKHGIEELIRAMNALNNKAESEQKSEAESEA